jgi:hypothetical protein
MSEQFYKPRPIAPEDNPQMRGLRWSLRVSVAGWIVYGAFAYAFADVGVIPMEIQSWMVLLGSVLIVAGAESNTIATTEAALSKIGTDRISAWDFAAVIASLVGGICSPLILFATRQPALAGTWWRQTAINSGPLILGFAGVFDFYGAVTELALGKRDHERSLGEWLEERRQWNEAHGVRVEVVLSDASIDDARRIVSQLNGQRATLDLGRLETELAKAGLRVPSRSTGNRWAKMARKGEL